MGQTIVLRLCSDLVDHQHLDGFLVLGADHLLELVRQTVSTSALMGGCSKDYSGQINL